MTSDWNQSSSLKRGMQLAWTAKMAGSKVGQKVAAAAKGLHGSGGPLERYHVGKALTWQLVDEVLEVELHRKPCNEIGTTMLAELDALSRFAERVAGNEARALIFHSSVDRGFSAGADLRELYEGLVARHQQSNDSSRTSIGVIKERIGIAWDVRAFIDQIHETFDRLDMLPMTTIGALNGAVFGGGFELALTCDVLVADQSTRFAFPELRLGLIPGFGGIPRLRRDVGNAAIRDLLLSGRSLNAKRAHQIGLVSQVVPRGRAIDAARSLAKQAGRFDARTTASAKTFIKPLPSEELAREKDLFIQMMDSPVVEEALKKFYESTDVRPYLP